MAKTKHPRRCDCAVCAWRRAMDVIEHAISLGIRPDDPDRTVMVRSYTVRAHARRNPRHLASLPRTRQFLRAALAKRSKKK